MHPSSCTPLKPAHSISCPTARVQDGADSMLQQLQGKLGITLPAEDVERFKQHAASLDFSAMAQDVQGMAEGALDK